MRSRGGMALSPLKDTPFSSIKHPALRRGQAKCSYFSQTRWGWLDRRSAQGRRAMAEAKASPSVWMCQGSQACLGRRA